jgi:GrpB-like predicted nucleotidyltransferase (UPF0157 family)
MNMTIPVTLAPYDPAWQEHAQKLIAQLNTTTLFNHIHHIGSTAIPGIIAKPIIDLMPLVESINTLDQHRAKIENLGYTWHGEFGIPDRRYCRLNDPNGTRIAQLHIFETTSPNVTRHLAFRNYLRAHTAIARAYENEKRRARDLHPNSSHAYSNEKSGWITEVEAKALLWFTA